MFIVQLSIICDYSYVTNSNLPNVRWFYLYVYSVLNHHFSICVLTVDTMYRTSCLNITNKMYISLAGSQWRHMREYIYRLIKYISIYTWRVYDEPSYLVIQYLNNSLTSILGLFIDFSPVMHICLLLITIEILKTFKNTAITILWINL